MAINLQKGGNVNLSHEVPGLSQIFFGLGWDPRPSEGAPFDLDGCAFLLGPDGKVRSDADLIFYNNLVSNEGAVEHSGDNPEGRADGDDERLMVDLARMPADVERIVVAVTIHEAEHRRQNFGMIGHARIRCVNAGNDREIARYDLTDDCSSETSMVFGELYRSGSQWQFRAVGQGYYGELAPLARSYGVNA